MNLEITRPWTVVAAVAAAGLVVGGSVLGITSVNAAQATTRCEQAATALGDAVELSDRADERAQAAIERARGLKGYAFTERGPGFIQDVEQDRQRFSAIEPQTDCASQADAEGMIASAERLQFVTTDLQQSVRDLEADLVTFDADGLEGVVAAVLEDRHAALLAASGQVAAAESALERAEGTLGYDLRGGAAERMAAVREAMAAVLAVDPPRTAMSRDSAELLSSSVALLASRTAVLRSATETLVADLDEHESEVRREAAEQERQSEAQPQWTAEPPPEREPTPWTPAPQWPEPQQTTDPTPTDTSTTPAPTTDPPTTDPPETEEPEPPPSSDPPAPQPEPTVPPPPDPPQEDPAPDPGAGDLPAP